MNAPVGTALVDLVKRPADPADGPPAPAQPKPPAPPVHPVPLAPVAEVPPADAPAPDAPAAEAPAADAPAAEAPAAEAPPPDAPAASADTPVAETPAAGTPAADTPATDTPAKRATARRPAKTAAPGEAPVRRTAKRAASAADAPPAETAERPVRRRTAKAAAPAAATTTDTPPNTAPAATPGTAPTPPKVAGAQAAEAPPAAPDGAPPAEGPSTPTPAGQARKPAPGWRSLPAGRRRAIAAGLAALCALAGAGAGAVAGSARAANHAAAAEVVYPIAQELPTGFLRQDRALNTQLVLIRGQGVLGALAARHGTTYEDLREHVKASVMSDSEVIRIEVDAPDVRDAVAIAQEVADGYLSAATAAWRTESDRLGGELSAIDAGLRGARERRDSLVLQAMTAAPTASLDGVVSDVDAQISVLLTRQANVKAAADELAQAPSPRLAAGSYPLDGTVGRNPTLTAGAGGLVGLLVGLAGAAALLRRGRAPE